ncbi:MAG: hypothetical protein WC821_00730 [archaeon]|jgi:hypothetical protein
MVVRSFGGAKKVRSFKPNSTLRFGEIKRVQIVERRPTGMNADLARIKVQLEKMTPKQLQKEVFKLTSVEPVQGTFRFKGTGTRLSEETYYKLGEYQNPLALKDREGLIRILLQARREIVRGKK